MPSWVQKSDKLLQCITNLDQSLDNDRFVVLLKGIASKAPIDDFDKIHIKILSFIWNRSQLFIMTPTQLTRDLLDLGFSNEKATHYVKQWTDHLKCFITNLEFENGELNELQDMSWRLDVELVSSGLNRKQRTKAPIGTINLRTTSDSESLQLDHSNLSTLFNALEEIQSEVDSIRAST